MNIAICTAFREASSYIDRYFSQMEILQKEIRSRKHHLVLVLVYGDSKDGTGELLWEKVQYNFGAILVGCDHGGKKFGSIVSPERFKQLSLIANTLWNNIPQGADVSMLLDGDLIWEADTLIKLIDRLDQVPLVAPKILHQSNPGLYKGEGPFWYDTFAFRRNGATFGNSPPWYPALEHIARSGGGLVQVDSVGGCFAVRSAEAQGLCFPEEDVVVGFCKQFYNRGGSIWLDYNLEVFHP